MTALAPPQIPILDWHGCYGGHWRNMIAPEAFAHPAKFAPALIERIYRHGLARGYWRRGELIGDPFGGVATGGIVAGYCDLDWFGVELEPRFVALGHHSLALHARKFERLGRRARLVHGDSRRFAEIVSGAGGVVTSPPYAATGIGGPHEATARQVTSNGATARNQNDLHYSAGYGIETPGQIGALPAGAVRDVGETYWQAMRTVYAQCLIALPPGGYMAVVIKDYVQKKARVPLCDQTLVLLTALGFEPIERARAHLVSETDEGCLFTGKRTRRKERKSFFRRIQEAKGAPRIDWEEVLFVRKRS